MAAACTGPRDLAVTRRVARALSDDRGCGERSGPTRPRPSTPSARLTGYASRCGYARATVSKTKPYEVLSGAFHRFPSQGFPRAFQERYRTFQGAQECSRTCQALPRTLCSLPRLSKTFQGLLPRRSSGVQGLPQAAREFPRTAYLFLTIVAPRRQKGRPRPPKSFHALANRVPSVSQGLHEPLETGRFILCRFAQLWTNLAKCRPDLANISSACVQERSSLATWVQISPLWVEVSAHRAIVRQLSGNFGTASRLAGIAGDTCRGRVPNKHLVIVGSCSSLSLPPSGSPATPKGHPGRRNDRRPGQLEVVSTGRRRGGSPVAG